MRAIKNHTIPLLIVFSIFFSCAISAQSKTDTGSTDWMKVNSEKKELIFSATVTKNPSKSAVTKWGQRGQAWIGCKGGSQEKFFIFTTDLPRKKIDDAIKDLGVKHTNQIEKSGWKKRKGLKENTAMEDFLDGDPMVVSIRFEKDGKTVQLPLERFIDEKVEIKKKEVLRPHTPHYVYHGTGEAIKYPSGCIVCPSDCFGGIITDNRLPILTYDSWYRVNWEKMPAVGKKVEVIFQFTVL